MWSLGHHGQRERPVVVGQAFAGQHQVWEIVPHEPRHSTAGSTRVCVKPEETGPKRRNKFARHERPLKSQAKRPGNRPGKKHYEK
jgi:hypothetical protein